MLSPTFAITIVFPILFTINTYINYKSHAFIPQHGPFEPYLSLLLHLIVQLSTLQAAWGWSSPVLVKRLSSLARNGADDQGMDEERRKAVNKVLTSYQTSCVFLFGTVLIPFICLSRAYSTQQLGTALIYGEYVRIGLWAFAALACGGCFRLWTAVYKENQRRIAQIVNPESNATQCNHSSEKPWMPEEKLQDEVVPEKHEVVGDV
ncbi:hypothetical protein QFC20_007552 [Naganishia adeliensis]|uniref:Uncharacterized protein n=1 Tax=Naganishia adeliensis TaxID=92952 RepID=A0ACC2UYM8_9TREE|nr:hypothetical protein QFC20_007552 [Naganishia adeliensis]